LKKKEEAELNAIRSRTKKPFDKKIFETEEFG
jgi:hypothetical protein